MLIQAFIDWPIFLAQEGFCIKLAEVTRCSQADTDKAICTVVRILALVHPLGSCFLYLQILSGQKVVYSSRG